LDLPSLQEPCHSHDYTNITLLSRICEIPTYFVALHAIPLFWVKYFCIWNIPSGVSITNIYKNLQSQTTPLGAITSCCLINMFIKVCWLWLQNVIVIDAGKWKLQHLNSNKLKIAFSVSYNVCILVLLVIKSKKIHFDVTHSILYTVLAHTCYSSFEPCSGRNTRKYILYFSIHNVHLMYNVHPKLFRHSFWYIDNAHDAN
jgi:hypothetical protein